MIPQAPLIVAEAVWQYSHHVLHGLITHKGPILTVANWSGTWPGLVGMLNLNGSLTKAGVKYGSLWSEDFTDEFFTRGLHSHGCGTATVRHDTGHVCPYDEAEAPRPDVGPDSATSSPKTLQRDKAIMGIFDEGCMGMYNAIIPDELLHKTGVYKERLSQSGLYAKMQTVSATTRPAPSISGSWTSGLKFQFGAWTRPTDLTEAQVLGQCKMYVAAMRIADEFGCATIGIQYQQGLKDLAPASRLGRRIRSTTWSARPSSTRRPARNCTRANALPHFNEVDECAGLDALVTNRLWKQMGYRPRRPSTTCAGAVSIRDEGLDEYVWLFEISGAAPPAHFANGATRTPAASASRPCTSAWAAAPEKASASRATSSGAACSSRTGRPEVRHGPGRSRVPA